MPDSYGRRTDDEIEAENVNLARTLTRIGVGCVLGLVLLIGGCMGAMPKYDLYKAETGKRARVAEARAEADAEQYRADRAVETATAEAEARRIEAEGIRDAQDTIASSLTPEYISWFFIDRLDDIDGQVIYVPTEGGVPVMEAGRTTVTTRPAG
jgi:hypothetical protein